MNHSRNKLPQTRRDVLTKERALATLARMRRDDLSLTVASKLEETRPSTVRRYIGSALFQKSKRGPYKARRSDRVSRELNFLTAKGEIPITVRSSRTASKVGEYLNAIKTYLANGGDESVLKPYIGKSIRTTTGLFEFVTDPRILDELGGAGRVAVEGLYRAIQGSSA